MSSRYFSSHSIAARSRWLVGSSSSSRSGSLISSFASASRERCPPESVCDILLPRFASEADAQQRRLQLVPPGISAGQVEFVLRLLVLTQDLLQRFAA